MVSIARCRPSASCRTLVTSPEHDPFLREIGIHLTYSSSFFFISVSLSAANRPFFYWAAELSCPLCLFRKRLFFLPGHFSLKETIIYYIIYPCIEVNRPKCLYLQGFDLSQRHITIEKVLHYAKKFLTMLFACIGISEGAASPHTVLKPCLTATRVPR